MHIARDPDRTCDIRCHQVGEVTELARPLERLQVIVCLENPRPTKEVPSEHMGGGSSFGFLSRRKLSPSFVVQIWG